MVICIDGWMTCDFMSFLTVFHLYKDNGWMIMKGVCNVILMIDLKDRLRWGSNQYS